MKLLQTYYTSCRIGQTGSSGFQFYSFSDGITEAERDEISKLGSYTAPYGSNSLPTEDETLNVLPIAFKYFRLSSGRVGVLQSTACTAEYTGRPGNFFTHALILEKGEFPFMPIFLHQSDYLRHDLTDEQKNIQSVPPLLVPLVIDESTVTDADWNNLSIQQFIKQGNNEELLSKLLDIVLTEKGTKKRIIMADNKPEDVIYVLSNALPSKNVAGLTFSTYSLHPSAQNVLLSASRYEGSDFNFDDAGARFSYYVFNNTNGKYAEVEEQSGFSKTLIRLLASEPQRMNEVYAYAGHFSGEKDIKSMDMIASIFERLGFASKWKQILPFVTDKAKPEYVETFLSEYKEQIVDLITGLQNEDDIVLLFENLLQLIRRLSDTSAWFNHLFSKYLLIILKRLESPTESLIKFNKRLLIIFKAADKEAFRKRFMSRDTFLILKQPAQTELAFMNVFTLIVSSVRELTGSIGKVDSLFSIEEIEGVIKNIDEDQTPPDSFRILISEASNEVDTLLLGISTVKANNLAKRLICELSAEKYMAVFHQMILKGILDNQAITNEIREEAISLLEKNALRNIPTSEELRLYAQLKNWIDNTEKYPAINLILKGKDLSFLSRQVNTFEHTTKLSVFLEWKSHDIFPNLKRPEDWKNFYSLSKHIPLDSLNLQVEKYFVQAKDPAPLVALIILGLDDKKNNERINSLLRKILIRMKRSAYNALKRDMKQRPDEVRDYFMSLDKGVLFKRFFNLIFKY